MTEEADAAVEVVKEASNPQSLKTERMIEAAVPVAAYSELQKSKAAGPPAGDSIVIPALKSPSQRGVTPASGTGMRPMKSVSFSVDSPDKAVPPLSAVSSEQFNEKPKQRGFIAIGDLIFLTAGELNSDKQPSRFVVVGDGVAHSEVECAPKKMFKMRSDVARYRQALFRVEPARQYGLLTRLNNPDKAASVLRVSTQSPGMSDKLKLQAKEEAEGNDDEFEMMSGNMVTYGERIQLRHMHSDTFLTLTNDIARERGCLKVGLDKQGNEGSWIEFMPENKFRQEGERVQFSDQFLISVSFDKSSYYIHMAPSSVFISTNARELNGSSRSTMWKARKYISRIDIKRNPEFVSTGDSFRIALKQNQHYLSVVDLGVRRFIQIKDKVVETEEEVKDDMTMLCKLDKNNAEEKPVEAKSMLYLDFEKSSGNVWELERENVFGGGVAMEFERFKIKHIATGFYLSIENESIIRAVSDGSKASTMFRFIPETASPQLRFNTLLKLQNVSTGSYVTAQEYSDSGKSSSANYLEVTNNPKDALHTTFFLEDEKEENTLHIHQVSVIIQKVSSYYKFLWYWGLLQMSNSEFIRDYKIAKEKEQELEKETEIMRRVMANLVEKILRPGQPGFKLRQETVMKTRLLELLLKLAELIAEKTQFPKVFLRSKLRKKRGVEEYDNFDLFKMRVKSWAMCPQLVAYRYLHPLASELYRTLYRCIEDNGNCCESLSMYVRFLSDQLTKYKEEVSQVLRAVLKQPVNIFEKLPKEQFAGLMDQVKPISVEARNEKEQALILRILASLCLRQKMGAANYQYLIREKLFQTPAIPNLCVFWNYSAKQCIELVFKDVPSDRLLASNPQLLEVAIKMRVDGRDHYLIPVHSLSEHPLLVKYLAAVLELLANLCLSRNQESIHTVTGTLGASFDIVFQCMQDQRVHPKLRSKFVKLCRVLFIDRHPCVPLSERPEEDARETELSTKFKYFQQHELLTVRIGEVVSWLDQTFRNATAPYPDDVSLKVKIRFTVELLRLAHDVISLQYATNELLEILRGMLLLMKDYLDLSIDPHSLHWCGALKFAISKRQKSLGATIIDVDELVQECLGNLKIACTVRANEQIAAFLQVFAKYLPQERVTSELSAAFIQEVFYDQDFARKKITLELSQIAQPMVQQHAEYRLLSMKQVAPEEKVAESDDSMDIFLLKLLFRSEKKNHERTALEIIIRNFDQRTRIREMLEGAELLVEDIFREKYKRLKLLYNRLRILLKDIQILSDIELFKEGGIDYQLDQCSDAFSLICTEVRKVVDLNEPAEIRRISQRIARNVGLFSLFFEFLGTKFSWVDRGNPMPLSPKARQGKQKKEALLVIKDERVLDLYRNAVSTLYNFCYANLAIQLLAYEKITLLLRLMDNKIGMSKLLGQAIASQRATGNARFIIEYVFMDLLAHTNDFTNRSHDIKMLNYLVHGEDGVYYTENQTQIFQAIIKYEPFRTKYHRRMNEKELCFAEFEYKENADIKFFGVLLNTVVKCSIQNSYVTMEARKLFPSDELLRQLQNMALPISLRKALFQYYIFVFCMNTHDGLQREASIRDFQRLISTAMLPHLQRVDEYLPLLYAVSRKAAYWPVPCKTSDKQWTRTTSAQLQGGSLKAFLFGIEQTDAQADNELTEEETQAKKYWKSIILFKPWKPMLSSGMLSLFMDLLEEISVHNVECDERLMDELESMSAAITSLIQKLRALQTRHSDLTLDYLIAKLETTFDLLPQDYLNRKIGDEMAIERDAIKKLAETVHAYMAQTGMTIDAFLTALCPHELVSKADLINSLKALFGKETTVDQLTTVMSAISRTETDIHLADFARALKPFLAESGTHQQVQGREKLDINPINKQLRVFLKSQYRELAREAEMQELQELVGRIEATIIEPALVKGDLEEIRRLNNNLEKAFREPKHKVYLLRIYQFIIHRVINDTVKTEAVRRQDLRKIVHESAITDMAAGLIYTDNTPSIIMEAFKLLNNLLKYNLKETQERLLDTITNKIDHFQFFSFIRSNIRDCLARIEALAQDKKRLKPVASTRYRPVDAQARITEAVDIDKSTSPQLTKLVLEFLKLCSDSCHAGFQRYFRTQDEESGTVSIDLVNEISVLLINLQRSADLKSRTETETGICAHYALTILINLCSGPCRENQMVVGTRRQIYDFVKLVLAEDIDFTVSDNFFLELFKNSISLLAALLEGSGMPEVSKLMLSEIDIQRLVDQSIKVYQQLIKGRQPLIYQENTGEDIPILRCLQVRGRPVTEAQMKVIESGYQISILVRTLNDLHPNMKVWKMFFAEERKALSPESRDFQEEDDDTEVLRGLKPLYGGRSILRWSKMQLGLSVQSLTPSMAAFRFFSANIASVEINYKGTLVKQLFHIPYMCRFLSTRSHEAVLTKVKRTSHQEKIDDFFNRSAQYEQEMKHRQKLSRYPLLHGVCKMWEHFATMAFWLVLAVNLTILFSVYHDTGRTGSWTWETEIIESKAMVQSLGFVQLVLSVLIVIGHLVEYYPVIIYKRSEKQKIESPAQFFKAKWISIKGTMLIHDIIERTKRKVAHLVENPTFTYKFIAIVQDPSVLYHSLYCAISIIAWVKFLWYPILLLDVVKRREDLVNVLKSITLNYKSLVLTLVLGIITIYLFTIVAINLFPEFYLNEKTGIDNGTYNAAATYCTNLLDCFISTLIQGVRPGGGIGDNLFIPSFNGDKYWQLYMFDMLYFILVVIVLLNIIFGIIIDTFAELRDQRKEMLYDIEHNCFICGLDKFQFEVYRLPWTAHINLEHNVYAFLAYLIYIKQKNEEDCSGIELYVKSQIREKEVAFLPTDSLALQKVRAAEDDETQQEAAEIHALVSELKSRTVAKA